MRESAQWIFENLEPLNRVVHQNLSANDAAKFDLIFNYFMIHRARLQVHETRVVNTMREYNELVNKSDVKPTPSTSSEAEHLAHQLNAINIASLWDTSGLMEEETLAAAETSIDINDLNIRSTSENNVSSSSNSMVQVKSIDMENNVTTLRVTTQGTTTELQIKLDGNIMEPTVTVVPCNYGPENQNVIFTSPTQQDNGERFPMDTNSPPKCGNSSIKMDQKPDVKPAQAGPSKISSPIVDQQEEASPTTDDSPGSSISSGSPGDPSKPEEPSRHELEVAIRRFENEKIDEEGYVQVKTCNKCPFIAPVTSRAEQKHKKSCLSMKKNSMKPIIRTKWVLKKEAIWAYALWWPTAHANKIKNLRK